MGSLMGKESKEEMKERKKEKKEKGLRTVADAKAGRTGKDDKIVIAELDFDDWDFSTEKGKFEASYDASKTALTREEWDAAIGEVNGVMKHEGVKGFLCCLCGEAGHHVGDLKKKSASSRGSTRRRVPSSPSR